MDQIYTIPIEEAVDATLREGKGCPLCRLFATLEDNELDTVLGAAMMEPNVRAETNRLGFCGTHYDRMLKKKHRLELSLMLESHLATLDGELRENFFDKLLSPGKKPENAIRKKMGTCYICSRIDFHFQRMLETVAYLYSDRADFKKKWEEIPMFCLPHAKMLLEAGKRELNKKQFSEFSSAIRKKENAYMDKIRGDITFFTKQFDYQNQDRPWDGKEDAPERAIEFLTGVER